MVSTRRDLSNRLESNYSRDLRSAKPKTVYLWTLFIAS